MARVVKVKNTGAAADWQGQTIASGTYYALTETDLEFWKKNEEVFEDVGSGRLVINDGTNDFTSTVDGWDWLLGDNQTVITAGKDPFTGAIAYNYPERHAGDGKLRVLASHKPVLVGKEAYNFFTSRGDSLPGGVLASGNALMLEATSGTFCSSVDIHFSAEVNPAEQIYLFGGALSWENAGWGDCVNMEIRTIPTVVIPEPPAVSYGLSPDYNLDGERIVYAGPGLGTHALGSYPAWVPNFKNQGHWNLDSTKTAPVPASGVGAFDWCITDQFVGNYVADLLVYGTSTTPITIDATEAAPLPYGTYLRVRIHNNSNTDWKFWGFMKLYRERLK